MNSFNSMYLDPNLHSARHWLSQPKKRQIKKQPKIEEPVFYADVMDTFCFHWPDMRTYVLVRLLEKTIALYPIQSRLAFLYFHHAPAPELSPDHFLTNKKENVITLFQNWKHTLTLEEEEVKKEITLAQVIQHELNIDQGWIHAPCTIPLQLDLSSNLITIKTKNKSIQLIARCPLDKKIFLNLARLKNFNQPEVEIKPDPKPSKQHMNDAIIQHMEAKILKDIKHIEKANQHIEHYKKEILQYSDRLSKLDDAFDKILDSTQNVDIGSMKKVLRFVKKQLIISKEETRHDVERIQNVQERVSIHTLSLVDVIAKYDHITSQIRSHAWYPWLYTILAGLFIVLFMYFYFNH